MIGSDIMTIPAAGQSLYGKSVGDMIGNDVKVEASGKVKGTFHYVTGYTGFNEGNAEEQKGYFFPFKLAKKGTKMTIKKNGEETKKDIAWEADNVLRVTATDTFEIIVDGASVVKFTFAEAIFEKGA